MEGFIVLRMTFDRDLEPNGQHWQHRSLTQDLLPSNANIGTLAFQSLRVPNGRVGFGTKSGSEPTRPTQIDSVDLSRLIKIQVAPSTELRHFLQSTASAVRVQAAQTCKRCSDCMMFEL